MLGKSGPSVDTLAFQAVQGRFACDTGAGQRREIGLALDGARWHTIPQLTCPEGLHPVFLPPYSPELQPAERVWLLTDVPLKNRHFPILDALTELPVARCRWLEGQDEWVRSLTLFQWWPHRIS